MSASANKPPAWSANKNWKFKCGDCVQFPPGVKQAPCPVAMTVVQSGRAICGERGARMRPKC